MMNPEDIRVPNDLIDSAINSTNASLFEALNDIKISREGLETLKILKQKMAFMENYPFRIQNPEEENFNKMVETLKQRASFILHKIKCIVNMTCSDIHEQINAQLYVRNNYQKLAANGYADFDFEDSIQTWCDGATKMAPDFLNVVEKAANFLTQLNDCVGRQQLNEHIQTLQHLRSQFIASFERLIKSSMAEDKILIRFSGKNYAQCCQLHHDCTFIITKQPPQVMKTNTKFEAHLRLLVGAKPKKSSGVLQGEVSAYILNANQANSFVTNEQLPMADERPEDKQDLDPRFLMGNILSNTGKMKYEKESNEFSVTLKNMQLKKIKRGDKKDPQKQDLSVMDEKFVILFTANFKLDDGRNIFASAISLPVTVIVHGNQEARAWATITWDNGFSAPERTFFEVRNEVTWDEAFHVLNMKFTSATGRPLSPDDKSYLENKLIENQCMDKYSLKLSWFNFCKKKLKDGHFSFWEWFYAIMKLIEDRLKDLWNDGLIIGFISKKNYEEKLKKCCPGTFLLRFSDTQLGKIATSFVETSKTGIGLDVFSVNPYSSDELSTRSLPDRLLDEEKCKYLFPDALKEQAFGKFNMPTDSTIQVGGYLRRELREKVIDTPKTTNAAASTVFISTPFSGSMNSPALAASISSPAYFMNSPTPAISTIFPGLFISSQSLEGSSQSSSDLPDSTHQNSSSTFATTIPNNYQSFSDTNYFDLRVPTFMEVPEDNPTANSSSTPIEQLLEL